MTKEDTDREITEYLRRADANVRALRNLRNDLQVARGAYVDAITSGDVGSELYRQTVKGELANLIELVKERLVQAERTACFD